MFSPSRAGHRWAGEVKDKRDALVAGAVLLGVGWDLVGLCRGPVLENIATLSPRGIVFVVAMALGMILHRVWPRRRAGAQMPSEPAIPAVNV